MLKKKFKFDERIKVTNSKELTLLEILKMPDTEDRDPFKIELGKVDKETLFLSIESSLLGKKVSLELGHSGRSIINFPTVNILDAEKQLKLINYTIRMFIKEDSLEERRITHG